MLLVREQNKEKKRVGSSSRGIKKLKTTTQHSSSSSSSVVDDDDSSSSSKKKSSPFGDSNLNSGGRFVWWKKIERDQGRRRRVGSVEYSEEEEMAAEIAKLRKRREERAVEKDRSEEEMAILAREGAKAGFQEDWEKKEEEFDFHQRKLRIRRKATHDQTPTPTTHDTDIDIDIAYWEALLVVCSWELADAAQRRSKDQELLLAQEESRFLHSSIDPDVTNLLQGKTSVELEALGTRIQSLMSSGTAKDTVEFWEVVLRRLRIYKAKACLKEIHHAQMMLRRKQYLQPHPEVERPSTAAASECADELQQHSTEEAGDIDHHEHEHDTAEYEAAGSFSPELFHGGDDNVEDAAMDPEVEDRATGILENKRGGDALFGGSGAAELTLLDSQSQAYWWHGKYRPRKPKYFNRVHTGYEWNKYNRTHYDHDNPPPKFVKGYKFDIFYPDLFDKTKAPTYTVEKDEERSNGEETCILTFHAGPPYQDIAFGIMNKDWDRSPKNGFKSTFERGILHLYFNFKRYPYRR
ncbi:hypothetical protein Tsubulata_041685 [Turnera subulata]|uniref:Splicing factor Cactin n=1 Tax=Turnera subulata TaxID=218843 RepID=A0A9Q0G4L3_9ROSI|nr:hypothetical protein Tsubulata_041685 [Turnera subulata]